MEQTWKRPVPLQRRVLCAAAVVAVLSLAVFGVWHDALRGPFLFDDLPSIVQSPNVRRPASLWEAAWAPAGSGANARPLVALSLAANHAIGGLDPFGYHLFNVVLHALCAIVLCDFARRLSSSLFFGLGLALAWSVHPLVTDAVNSVIGRNELLVALFGLIALDAAQAGFERINLGRRPKLPFALCIGAAVFAALSKEVAVVVPLLVALLLRSQHSGIRWRSVRSFLLVLAGATWIPLSLLVIFGERGESVGFEAETVSSLEYLGTQGSALVIYLNQSLEPLELVADYGDWADSSAQLLETGLGGLKILALLIPVALGALRAPSQSQRAAAFAALSALLWLVPSSTVVPLAGEVVAEHRAYLPLAAIVTLALGGLWQIGMMLPVRQRQAGFMIGGALVFVLAGLSARLTKERNEIWQSSLTFWEDVVKKRGNNLRARNSYAVALAASGQSAEAEKQYRAVLDKNPRHTKAQNNLANLIASRDPEEAEQLFRNVLEREPDHVEALTNFANLRYQRGGSSESFELWNRALEVDPEAAATLFNRGEARIAIGRIREGIADLESAVAIEPDLIAARARLAWHLAVTSDEEVRNPQRALQWTRGTNPGPRMLDARAAALAGLGDFEQAVSVAVRAAKDARARSLSQLAADIETRAALYRQGRPYVQQR